MDYMKWSSTLGEWFGVSICDLALLSSSWPNYITWLVALNLKV
jgi:hypothetical protein